MAVLMMVIIKVITYFYDYSQACKKRWGGSFDEVCLTCQQSKANIGR